VWVLLYMLEIIYSGYIYAIGRVVYFFLIQKICIRISLSEKLYLNEKRKAGVDVKLNDIIRKRAMYGVALFCIAAIATVGALSMGGNNEDTPDSYVDLNETQEPGKDETQVADRQENTLAQENTGETQVTENEKVTEQNQKPEQVTADNNEVKETEVQVADKEARPEEPLVTEKVPVQTVENEPVQEPQQTEEPEQTEVLSPQLVAEQLTFNKASGLMWPVEGEVVIPYSPEHGVFHYTLEQFGTSDAVVLSASVGTEVKAAAKGVVTSITEDYRTGTTVTLAVGNDTTLVYGQLDLTELTEGDVVEAGECIGTIAEPTRYYVVEGPSLYFKVIEGEETLDPTSLFGEN